MAAHRHDMRATDPADPIIFHEVTGRAASTARVTGEDLLRAGASLVPTALRARYPAHATLRRGWPVPPPGRERWHEWDPTGLTGGIDHMAGDDRLVFFDLGWCRANGYRPAFGFRLHDVVAWSGGMRVGFRPHDLGSLYSTADVEYLSGLRSVNEARWRILTESVRALAADPTLREVLHRLAACGTAYDAAGPLARAHLLAVHRREDTWDRVEHMVPRCPRETPDVPRRDLPAAWALHWGLGRLGWQRAFVAHDDKLSRAEVVVAGPVPVRLARFYLAAHRWDLNPLYRRGMLP